MPATILHREHGREIADGRARLLGRYLLALAAFAASTASAAWRTFV